MNPRAQALIEHYLQTRGQATSTELVRLLHKHQAGVDYRKAICRARKKGMSITNVAPAGRVANYVLDYQPPLI